MKYVYKIIAALGALAVLPLAVFNQNFFYKVSSTALQSIMYIIQLKNPDSVSQYLNADGTIPDTVSDSVSLFDLFKLTKGTGGAISSADISSVLEAIKVPAITLLIIFALLIICAVVTAVLAFAAKDNRKVVYSSIFGIGLSVMFKFAFESLVAPFVDGTISLADVVSSWWAVLVAQVEELSLSTMFYFIPGIFVCIIIWTLLYNITLPEKEKKARKIMLGEAETDNTAE